MAFPQREGALQVCTVAAALSQSLERELLRLEAGTATPRLKEVYDVVYLPRLDALIHQAKRHIEFEDWQLLCQPLHPDLADTQLQVVTELLDLIVMALNPPQQ
jgi:hypothetical protein